MMLHNREYSEPELKAYIHKLELEIEAKDEIIRLAVKDLDKLSGWYAVINERNCLLKISCMDCPLYTPGKANCEWRYRKRAKELIKDV